MNRFLFSAIVLLSAISFAAGQTPTPTPAPAPADDKQNVAPEDLPNVPSIAPDYQSRIRDLPDLGRVGVDMATQRSLTVRDAVTLALENNKDIEITRQNVKIAEFDLTAARGFFQPRLSGIAQYADTTVPNVSPFTANQKNRTSNLVGNATITGYIPKFGTQLIGDIRNEQVGTNNPISILSPQYNASLGFKIVQPLFRGRSIDQGRRQIEVAKKNLSLTDAQFRQRTIEIVTNVQRAYWDLTFALRNLQVQRDAVRDAKNQMEHNRRLVLEGQLAPIDVVAAETQVANFEQAVYEALNTVSQTENTLKNLISPNKNDAVWSESITPVDPVELRVPVTSLNDAITTALANRPELDSNQVQKDINAIDQKFFKNQTQPQIDLVAGYTSLGIGGEQSRRFQPVFTTPCQEDPTLPECQAQQAALAALMGNPYQKIFENKYPTYSVGLQFNLPLFGDKTAKANLGASRVVGDRLQTQREQLEQNIQVEVRNSLQAVRTAEARLRAAAISRENTTKQYESEQRKLDAGQSDIYTVLERQTALTVARSLELRTQTELNKAITDLHRATGNALKENDVTMLTRK
ncbi:MAG TPA: TolC family protein [Pyrinomonadaceae bacterium]|nr:TolC family protein [Pyrinomonadaceae bacterium]